MASDPKQPAGDSSELPARERRFLSGRLSIEQIELGQQITTQQAEDIIADLIEADRNFRRTPKKPEPYRARYRRGD